MTLGRSLLVAAILQAVAASAWSDGLLVVPGLTWSSGLGEQQFSPLISVAVQLGESKLRVEFSGFYELSRKYTGKGYIAGADTSLMVFVGPRWYLAGRADVHYRESGTFNKTVGLVGGGVGTCLVQQDGVIHDVRASVVSEVYSTSDNNIMQAQLRHRGQGPIGASRKWFWQSEIALNFQQFNNTGGGSRQYGSFIQIRLGAVRSW